MQSELINCRPSQGQGTELSHPTALISPIQRTDESGSAEFVTSRFKLEYEVLDLAHRWNDCLAAGVEAGGRVTYGSFLNMQAALRDARGLFARVIASQDRLTADGNRTLGEVAGEFQLIAEQCKDQLIAFTGRVMDGRRVRLAVLRETDDVFQKLLGVFYRVMDGDQLAVDEGTLTAA